MKMRRRVFDKRGCKKQVESDAKSMQDGSSPLGLEVWLDESREDAGIKHRVDGVLALGFLKSD